jgi:hypothetical protein
VQVVPFLLDDVQCIIAVTRFRRPFIDNVDWVIGNSAAMAGGAGGRFADN